MSQLARDNGWHGFDSIGVKVPGGYEYVCDGVPSPMGCGESMIITTRLANTRPKRSGWLVCYGLDDDGKPDRDVVLTFCPKCAAVVAEQSAAHS